jgi:6-phosphofructokinase 1
MAGKLLIGQAGGATAVINSSLAGIVEEAQRDGRFSAIWGMRRAAEGALLGDFLDLTTISPPHLTRLAATPGAALASSRHRIDGTDAERLLTIFDRNDIRTFIYIGGNDSADTTHRLAVLAADRGQPLCAIAVPKTIDNDLPVTDHSPGYASTARYVAVAAMDSSKDTESMPSMYPVKFIEVMGRNAGWIAAASALGRVDPDDAPHLIYMPERPVSREQILEDVARTHRRLGMAVAVVTETMRDRCGEPFADPALSADRDAFGHPLLRGTADTMCRLVQSELGLRSRYDKPGSLQRMSMLCVSAVDLEEARMAGRAAVRLAITGATDRMVTIVRDANDPYASHMDSAPLQEIANRQRLLPDAFLTQDGRDVTDAFRAYAFPLLGPDPLPHYARLDAAVVIARA